MFDDGSNPEGVAPSPPLGWKSRADMVDVKLFGNFNSPPCNKVRMWLLYLDIPFEQDNRYPLAIRSTPYKKVPVLINNGRQVNDSRYIVEGLCRACDMKFEAEWEEVFTYGLYHAFVHETTGDDMAAMMSHPISSPLLAMIPFCNSGCLQFLPKSLLAKIPKESLTDLSDNSQKAVGDVRYSGFPKLRAIFTKFRDAMGNNDFYGGASPRHPDISLFGAIARAYFQQLPTCVAAVHDSGLEEWMKRMRTVMPLDKFLGDNKTF